MTTFKYESDNYKNNDQRQTCKQRLGRSSKTQGRTSKDHKERKNRNEGKIRKPNPKRIPKRLRPRKNSILQSQRRSTDSKERLESKDFFYTYLVGWLLSLIKLQQFIIDNSHTDDQEVNGSPHRSARLNPDTTISLDKANHKLRGMTK